MWCSAVWCGVWLVECSGVKKGGPRVVRALLVIRLLVALTTFLLKSERRECIYILHSLGEAHLCGGGGWVWDGWVGWVGKGEVWMGG